MLGKGNQERFLPSYLDVLYGKQQRGMNILPLPPPKKSRKDLLKDAEHLFFGGGGRQQPNNGRPELCRCISRPSQTHVYVIFWGGLRMKGSWLNKEAKC